MTRSFAALDEMQFRVEMHDRLYRPWLHNAGKYQAHSYGFMELTRVVGALIPPMLEDLPSLNSIGVMSARCIEGVVACCSFLSSTNGSVSTMYSQNVADYDDYSHHDIITMLSRNLSNLSHALKSQFTLEPARSTPREEDNEYVYIVREGVCNLLSVFINYYVWVNKSNLADLNKLVTLHLLENEKKDIFYNRRSIEMSAALESVKK